MVSGGSGRPLMGRHSDEGVVSGLAPACALVAYEPGLLCEAHDVERNQGGLGETGGYTLKQAVALMQGA